jgi:O-antigen ligase/tetratricopeptide (TPR) repeat protein
LTVNCIVTESQIKRILNAILMAGAGIALFGILQYLGVADRSWWDKPLFLSATYVNHNHFAGLMEFTIPLSVGMVLSAKDTGRKFLYIYCFLMLCTAFLLSMSRGGWLSLTVSMIFMTAMILRKNRARFIFFVFVLLIITLGLFISNTDYVHSLFERVSSYGELDFEGRLEIWKGAAGIIKDNWLLGTGPGTFIYNFPKYRPAGFNAFANYAHNDYLQIASEMGIFALCLMIFIIWRIFKKALMTHRIARTSFKSWISLSLAAGVLSLSLHGLGDFNFYIPANVIIFTVFSALIFNISSKREKEYPQLVLKLNPVLRRFFKPLIVMTIVTSIIFINANLLAEICSTASGKAILRNDLEKAECLSLAATRLSPFNYLYPYKLATIYNKKAQRETDWSQYINKSVERYKEALCLNPRDAWSWIGLADSYCQLFRYVLIDGNFCELADDAYRKAIDLDPLNWYYLKRHAGFLLNSGNAGSSSRMYKRASSAMSKSKGHSLMAEAVIDGESYGEIADLAFADQDINKAMAYYEMADAIMGGNKDARLGQVRCYLKMSRIKDALLRYRGLESSSKNKSMLFASLGECYLNKGYIETARRFFEKSVATDPLNPEAYQLEYKMSRKRVESGYISGAIYKILDFNRIPVSVDFISGGFNLGFDIKKDMYDRKEFGIDIFLPAGMYEFKIKAKGEDALSIWPHMMVKFNNKRVMDVYVSDDWKEYSGIIIVDCPANRFGIVFDNDYYDEVSMKDRNLYIDGIKLKTL